jgi:hypothetical protein
MGWERKELGVKYIQKFEDFLAMVYQINYKKR